VQEFSFKDKDENRQLDMLEWLGSNCTNYSGYNALAFILSIAYMEVMAYPDQCSSYEL
jgi:hypothetical protein